MCCGAKVTVLQALDIAIALLQGGRLFDHLHVPSFLYYGIKRTSLHGRRTEY